MQKIREFEADVRALPGFPGVCRRKAGTLALPAALEHCEAFEASPQIIGFATLTNVSVAAAAADFGGGCCGCDGQPADAGKSGPCLQGFMGVCTNATSDPSTTALVFLNPLDAVTEGSGWAAAADTSALDGALFGPASKSMPQQMATAFACDTPKLPGQDALRYLVDRNFTADDPRSTTTRASMKLGGIIDQTLGEDARDKAHGEINAKVKAFIMDELIPLMNTYNEGKDDDASNHPIRIAQLSMNHLEAAFHEMIGGTAPWSLCSFLFVTGFMWYHTHSLFLSLLGQAHILVSFPAAWFVYRVVFGIEYMARRRSSAEHLLATKALRCTATAWNLTVAERLAKF